MSIKICATSKVTTHLAATGDFGNQNISALEATQGQLDDFFSQIPCKCHLEEVASVGD